ncbi:MAG: PIN domain-containing protein [Bacillota bacterium]
MSKKVVVPVVIDTSVLVPSVYSSSPLLQFLLTGNLILIWNNFIKDEALRITDELWDWYAAKNPDITRKEIIELLNMVFEDGITVPEMPLDWPPASKDRNDDPFLWAAVNGKAEYIISLDKRHIIELGSFCGIPIGDVDSFFKWAKSERPMSRPHLVINLIKRLNYKLAKSINRNSP